VRFTTCAEHHSQYTIKVTEYDPASIDRYRAMKKLLTALVVIIGLGTAVMMISLSLPSTNVVEACVGTGC
jgi:hypothetical protein